MKDLLVYGMLIIIIMVSFAFTHELTEQVKAQKETINQMATHIQEQSDLMNEYVKENTEINNKNAQMHQQLEGMKGRTKALLARPLVVESMINKSYTSFEERLACITGLSASCY